MTGINANAPAAERPATNSMIGIYALADASVAVKRRPNNMIGTVANVQAAA